MADIKSTPAYESFSEAERRALFRGSPEEQAVIMESYEEWRNRVSSGMGSAATQISKESI